VEQHGGDEQQCDDAMHQLGDLHGDDPGAVERKYPLARQYYDQASAAPARRASITGSHPDCK
jgi:hypothetical protein